MTIYELRFTDNEFNSRITHYELRFMLPNTLPEKWGGGP